MKKLALLLALLVLPVAAVFADTADADKTAVARHIIEAQTPDGFNKKGGDLFVLMFTPLVIRENPGKDDKVKEIMESSVAPLFASLREGMMQRSIDQLVAEFSLEELQQIDAFVASPLGDKYRKFNIDLAAKLKDSTKTDTAIRVQESMHALAAQLKANGLKVPAEIDK